MAGIARAKSVHRGTLTMVIPFAMLPQKLQTQFKRWGMDRSFLKQCVLTFSLLLLSSASLLTQTTNTGAVVGTVTDASGAVVPGAPIVMVGIGTGETRHTETNRSGQYTFPTLPPGRYRITITHTGF